MAAATPLQQRQRALGLTLLAQQLHNALVGLEGQGCLGERQKKPQCPPQLSLIDRQSRQYQLGRVTALITCQPMAPLRQR
jgi:hypothetical protein